MKNEVAELREENRRLRRDLGGADRREGDRREGYRRDRDERRDRDRPRDSEQKTDRTERKERSERKDSKEARKDDAPRRGKLRGKFVRLGERVHREKRYRVIEVRHPEFDKTQVFYVWPPRGQEVEGRHRELHKMAERLKRGQTVEISFGSEADVRWASGIKVIKERDREQEKEKDKDRREED